MHLLQKCIELILKAHLGILKKKNLYYEIISNQVQIFWFKDFR